MQIHIFDSPEQVSHAAATLMAAQLLHKPDSVLGLATGSTPVGTYQHLIAMHQAGYLDFSRAVSFNLDEIFTFPYRGSQERFCTLYHGLVMVLPEISGKRFRINDV